MRSSSKFVGVVTCLDGCSVVRSQVSRVLSTVHDIDKITFNAKEEDGIRTSNGVACFVSITFVCAYVK